MRKFEYKIVTADRKKRYSSEIDKEALEVLLIGYGLEEWEMVSSFRQSLNTGINEYCLILKREVPEEV